MRQFAIVAGIISAGLASAPVDGVRAQATSEVELGEGAVEVQPYQHAVAGSPMNVALFQNNLPWGGDADAEVLIDHGISFTVFNSSSMGVVDLSVFDKVILSNQQSGTFIADVQANREWLEAWVLEGGCLLNGLAHYSSDLPSGTTYPGDVTYIQVSNDVVEIVDPGHEVVTEPNPITEAMLNGWGSSSHGELVGGGDTVVVNAGGSSGPALAVKVWGDGTITSTTQPYQWRDASPEFAENIVLYQPCGGDPTPIALESWSRIKLRHRP